MIIFVEVFFFDENQNSLGVFQLKTGQVIKTTNLEYAKNYFFLNLSFSIESPIVGFINFEKIDAFTLSSNKQVLVVVENKKYILYKAE